MQLKIYNTETRQKEPVQSHQGTVRMYTCGPTIYDFAHIGNFRTYIFEDVLRRTIQYFGLGVNQVMNITDLDDKTIGGAIRKNIPLKEFTDPFKKAFFEDLHTLHIQKAEHYPAATDYIPEMIQMIQTLIDKGFAYRSPNGSIYFSINKFPSYGRLSHLKMDELKVNASGDNEADEYEKDNLSDFVLWKAYDSCRDGKIFWESPFGPGRPGWHIECSAMSTKLLGPTLDIHCGGVDNMFPHHENEIAQSECCTGHHFVHIWAHSEHLLVDHKKMSKSLGNFYTLRDLLKKGYTGEEVRYLLLSTHYRTQLNFTFAGLDGARSSLKRVEEFILRVRAIPRTQSHPLGNAVEKARKQFKEALADDLNISVALAALFELIRELNIRFDRVGYEEAQNVLELFEEANQIVAILPLQKEETPIHLLELLEQRELARKTKNWAQSDQIRDQIHQAGYEIDDTPQGARLKRK